MREILFKGKTVDGDWTYGYYVFTPKRTGMFGQTISSADFDRHYILTMKYNLAKEVIPETLGQYTGLTDKNGKKIFEGDIVKYEGYVYQCKWDEYNYEYVFDDGEGDFGIGYTSPYELEIIGNIHDNPELLKGE